MTHRDTDTASLRMSFSSSQANKRLREGCTERAERRLTRTYVILHSGQGQKNSRTKPDWTEGWAYQKNVPVKIGAAHRLILTLTTRRGTLESDARCWLKESKNKLEGPTKALTDRQTGGGGVYQTVRTGWFGDGDLNNRKETRRPILLCWSCRPKFSSHGKIKLFSTSERTRSATRGGTPVGHRASIQAALWPTDNSNVQWKRHTRSIELVDQEPLRALWGEGGGGLRCLQLLITATVILI